MVRILFCSIRLTLPYTHVWIKGSKSLSRGDWMLMTVIEYLTNDRAKLGKRNSIFFASLLSYLWFMNKFSQVCFKYVCTSLSTYLKSYIGRRKDTTGDRIGNFFCMIKRKYGFWHHKQLLKRPLQLHYYFIKRKSFINLIKCSILLLLLQLSSESCILATLNL